LLQQQASELIDYIHNTGFVSRNIRSKEILSFFSEFLFGEDDTLEQLESLKAKEDRLEEKAIRLSHQEKWLQMSQLAINHNNEILKSHMVEIEKWAGNALNKEDLYNKGFIILKEAY
jgi:hypothetical protein